MKSTSSLVTVDVPGATIADLCAQLGLAMDREVVDKTNLTGRYDVHLEVSPADLHPKYVAGRTLNDQTATAEGTDAGPSISTALQQLGLRLSTGTGPVPVIVIDHIESLTDN